MTARLRSARVVGAAAVLLFVVVSLLLLWWRGPDWASVWNAFELVSWEWVSAALCLNFLSVIARTFAWRTVIDQAVVPRPSLGRVFSAYSIGLLGNAVLPGRVGELARVAVLSRRMERGQGASATLLGRVRRLLSTARRGLGVMKSPIAAVLAILFQSLGWFFQLVAVWAAMRAFEIDAPLHAAALVLLLMNVATVFPLWPGNIGLLQAAVALPLVSYGVAYARGFAYGLGLQMVEAGGGIGLGVAFLTHEGISFATLKEMPETELPEARAIQAVE